MEQFGHVGVPRVATSKGLSAFAPQFGESAVIYSTVNKELLVWDSTSSNWSPVTAIRIPNTTLERAVRQARLSHFTLALQ